MKKIHRAWLVCAGCALLYFCTSGLAVNAFMVYQPYILVQNGLSNTQSSSLITVRNLCSFLTMFLSGVYYDKLSLRSGMLLAGLMTAGGFLCFGLAGSYPAYCAAAALVGFSYGLGTTIPVAMVLGRWFHRKFKLALSICSSVTGLSTLGLPTLITWLIENRSLRFAFTAEAGLIAALVLLSFLLVRSSPASVGLEPYGWGTEAEAEEQRHPQPHMLTRRRWIPVILMLLFLGAMTNVGYSHLTVRITTEGFDSYTAATAVTLSGIFLMLSKFLYGELTERYGCYRVNWLFGAVLLLGLGLCAMPLPGKGRMFLAVSAYSIGVAMTSLGLAAWAGDWSSHAEYEKTVRRFQIGYAAGSLLFGTMPGLLADRFGGSYRPAYLLMTVFAAAVMAVTQWLYALRERANR